jgi:hypothetical protein
MLRWYLVPSSAISHDGRRDGCLCQNNPPLRVQPQSQEVFAGWGKAPSRGTIRGHAMDVPMTATEVIARAATTTRATRTHLR